jgi:Zn-dependent peptidase ImmA (M78 family)/DNA-binding XRE family transcriptional regulator
MSSTPEFNMGERLRLARVAAGMTQDHAAERIGVARTTLVAIESGERKVRPSELLALSKTYGVSTNLLSRGTAVHVDFVGQFRRSRTSSKSVEASQRAIALLNRLASGYAELDARMGERYPQEYPPERILGRGPIDRQAEDLALELRSRLGVGLLPISDLLGLVELELGIRVFVHPLDSSIAGVYGFDTQVGACVLINSKHPIGRQLWTLAHEVAHFLVRRRATIVLLLDDEDASKDPAEAFADLFAGSLLMPAAAMRRAFDEFSSTGNGFTARHLILLSHRYHVSLEATARRLEYLGLLKRGTFEVLKERGLSGEMVQSVLGSEKPEPLRRRPTRLTLLAAAAIGQGVFTERQVGELLGLELLEVRELVDGLGPELQLGERKS